jgi:predicted  nucleic acid-binding Zn-ribbon protein
MTEEPRLGRRAIPARLTVEDAEALPTDMGTVLVRVAGRYKGPPGRERPPAVLVVEPDAEAMRFDALPGTSAAASRAASGEETFRVTFSVPDDLAHVLEGDLALEMGGAIAYVPPIEAPAGLVPDLETGTVVDRAALAERRARRAELAEEQTARRAADAESAINQLEAELAKLELRLDRAITERDELADRLADSASDLRAAAQRVYAEERRREEAVADEIARSESAGAQVDALREALDSATCRAVKLADENERLRRRTAENEHSVATAGAARTRAERRVEALTARLRAVEQAQREHTERPRIGDPERLREEREAWSEAGTAPPPAPVPDPVARPDLIAALLTSERDAIRAAEAGQAARAGAGPEGRALAQMHRVVADVRDVVSVAHERIRALERELADRDAMHADAQSTIELLRARIDDLRDQRSTATAPDPEHERLVSEFMATASDALSDAEQRIFEAQRAAVGMQEQLEVERSEREAIERQLGTLLVTQREEAEALEAELERLRRRGDEGAGGHHGLAEAIEDMAWPEEHERAGESDDPLEDDDDLRPLPESEHFDAARPVPAEALERPPSAPARMPGSPWLPDAITRMLADDPEAARRLLIHLIPGQTAELHQPLDYDIDLVGHGCIAISLGPQGAKVVPISEPRSRPHAQFGLELDALGLVALLVEGGERARAEGTPIRVRGTWRRRRALRAIPPASLRLGELARLNVWPDPALVYRALTHLFEPPWTSGHEFWVAQEVVGKQGGRWWVHVDGAKPVQVTDQPPPDGADASVRMTQAAFQHLLGAEPALRRRGGPKAEMRGDARVLEALGRWTDWAQGVGEPPTGRPPHPGRTA